MWWFDPSRYVFHEVTIPTSNHHFPLCQSLPHSSDLLPALLSLWLSPWSESQPIFPFYLKKLNQNHQVWWRQLGRIHAWLRDMEVRWRTDKERILFLFSTSPTAEVEKSLLRASPNHYPYIHSAALLNSFLRYSKRTTWSSSSQYDFPSFLFKARKKVHRRGCMSEP